MSLFQLGDFRLHSGAASRWKIDCDALTDEDWDTLALMIKERVPAFGCVVGIPTSGMKLERSLTRYEESDNDMVLIVDDVLTTAASMEKEKRIYLQASSIIHGAVVFARGPCPDWVTPLFQMPII